MALDRRRFLGLSALTLAAGALGLRAAARPGAVAPPRGDVRLALISDLNGPYGSIGYIPEVHRGIALLPSLRPDLVLCAGDMVAGQKPGLGRARLAAMWAGFERDVLGPVRAAGLPLAVTMGNHDASGALSGGRHVFADDRAEAGRFWGQRRDALSLAFVDAGGFPFHYALLQNDVFLLVWDASTATVPQTQLLWAERMLASPAARAARRRLVMGHLPLRAVGRGRDNGGDVLARPDALQALMERHDVEAYVSGHHHAWFPGRIGSLDLYHLGAMGSGPRRLLGSSEAPFQTLTVLDLFHAAGRTVATTLDLRTLTPVDPGRLPRRITDRTGRSVPLRPA
ncbi:MAG: metallophosphoesterase [Synechococcaceae cyanobacterium]|nr:metallophosphoesterase [Synechococcaceae cyanobacterium]